MSDETPSLVDFIQASPTPYHAVRVMAEHLKARGFAEISEKDAWSSAPGARQFVIRGGKSIIAWIGGTGPLASSGLRIVGAHTDSPCLRPRTGAIKTSFGMPVLETSVYGSPILPTWLDRDLGISGAITMAGEDAPRLFASTEPVLRTATLAIHLDKESREKGMKPNPHDKMNCIVTGKSGEDCKSVRDLVASVAGVAAADIRAMDLYLFDHDAPVATGGEAGFVSSARLDNLFSCYTALRALTEDDATHAATRMVAMFDAEEIGSRTWLGAMTGFLGQTIERLSAAMGDAGEGREAFHRAIAHSFLLSFDMAHANHPFFGDKLQHDNAPNLNGGVALKRSYRGHYAVSARLEGKIRELAGQHGIPVQDFMYREDLGGGSSIGPIASAELGMEAIDAGAGLIGMHSIREIAGAKDVGHSIDLLSKAFFAIP